MKYRTDKTEGEKAYLQLYRQLKSDIVAGLYPIGSKLPSKRLLAEESGVSVITVEHTYRLLCDEGYAESRQRSGYFVIYKQSDFNSVTEAKHTVAPITPQIAENGETFPFSVIVPSL